MLLKRNLPTILYSFLFLLCFGLGFLELVYLSITNTYYRNVIACIIVLGIIIYLIAAFFIKESRRLEFFQKDKSIYVLLETILAVLVCGTLFYLNIDRGIDNSILIVCMLAGVYFSARLLGGRLGGCVALVMGFFFILAVANETFDANQYMNTICFLLPYALFLFVTKVLVKSYLHNGFILCCSYLALAGIFALAIVLNPFVIILLFGCAFTLVFGKTEERGSRMALGFVAALLFVLFTALFLVGANLYLEDLFVLPELNLDIQIQQMTDYVEIGNYLLDKYTKAVRYLHQPFQYGVFPSILLLMATLAGYYGIRKKASGIGPLCLTYIIVLAIYLLFEEEGSHFYYMTYFLPVFAAYGLYNTLLSDTLAEEDIPAIKNEDEYGNLDQELILDQEIIPDQEIVPDSDTVAEKDSERILDSKTIVTNEKTENTEEEKPIEKKKEVVLEKEPNDITPLFEEKELPPPQKGDDLPEWSAPKQFLPGYQEEPEIEKPVLNLEPATGTESVAAGSVKKEPVTEPVKTEPMETEPVLEFEPVTEAEPVLKLQPATEAEPVLKLQPATEEEPVLEDKIVSESEPTTESFNDITVPQTSVEVEEENTLTPDNTIQFVEEAAIDKEEETPATDIEQFISLGAEGEQDSMISLEEDDDSQLNNFLERLDISDNIRRMNESAQEDMADVIESGDAEEESVPVILEEKEVSEDLEVISDGEGNFYTQDTKESHSTLPPYEKPDFNMNPVTKQVSNSAEELHEYDKVPTIEDLEKEWKAEQQKTTNNGFAYSLDDMIEAEPPKREESVEVTKEETESEYHVHSEEIVKKNGVAKRSYHKITIR
ncbi:MAG: hypothetical protein J1F22_04005 [Lachnospiraceae bacterium]|nr:hypothetical protein [Lachnospiraceae bacterium]